MVQPFQLVRKVSTALASQRRTRPARIGVGKFSIFVQRHQVVRLIWYRVQSCSVVARMPARGTLGAVALSVESVIVDFSKHYRKTEKVSCGLGGWMLHRSTTRNTVPNGPTTHVEISLTATPLGSCTGLSGMQEGAGNVLSNRPRYVKYRGFFLPAIHRH